MEVEEVASIRYCWYFSAISPVPSHVSRNDLKYISDVSISVYNGFNPESESSCKSFINSCVSVLISGTDDLNLSNIVVNLPFLSKFTTLFFNDIIYIFTWINILERINFTWIIHFLYVKIA